MKLTPLEVETEKFARRLRGYDIGEVDAFKRLVAVRLDELLRENAALKEKVAHLRDEVHELQAREQGIQETLYTARQLAEEMKTQARREADILRVEAELEGEQLKQAAEQDLRALNREMRELRGQRERMFVEFRAVLESHWRLLEVHAEQAPGASRPKPPRTPDGQPPRGAGSDSTGPERSRLSISALLARGRQLKSSGEGTGGRRSSTPSPRQAAGEGPTRRSSTPAGARGAPAGTAAEGESGSDADVDIELDVDESGLTEDAARAAGGGADGAEGGRPGPVLELVGQDGQRKDSRRRKRKRRRTPPPAPGQPKISSAEDAKG